MLGFSENASGRALRGGALLVLLAGLVVVLGLASGRAVDIRPEVPPMMSSATSTVLGPESTDMATPTAGAVVQDSGEPPPWWALAAVLLVGGMTAAALWRSVRRDDDAPSSARSISMIEALEALRAGADYPSTIVGCWQGLEAWALDRGVARGPAETVEEFSTRLSAEVSLDTEALVALGVLYQRARYAPTPPTSRDREQAVACLEALVGDRSVQGGTGGH